MCGLAIGFKNNWGGGLFLRLSTNDSQLGLRELEPSPAVLRRTDQAATHQEMGAQLWLWPSRGERRYAAAWGQFGVIILIFCHCGCCVVVGYIENVKHSKERQKNVTMLLRIVGVTTGSRILLVLVPNNTQDKHQSRASLDTQCGALLALHQPHHGMILIIALWYNNREGRVRVKNKTPFVFSLEKGQFTQIFPAKLYSESLTKDYIAL